MTDFGRISERKLSKVYLYYKMITSQNVPSKTQVINCFVLWKSSRDIKVFFKNNPMIYQICDVMMGYST